MASYKFPGQNNLNWAESFSMTAKVPAIANRIFETLADAQEYVNDENSTAIEGLILSVIKDSTNNGSYFVSKVGTASDPVGVLVKLAASSVSDDIAQDLSDLQTQLDGCDFEDSANNNGVEVSLKQVDGKVESISVDASELDAAAQSYADSAQEAAISAAASDATSKANQAKADAISAAASDATSKANSAEANAKTYADGKVNELKNSLSNALHFLGVSSTDPSTGVVTIGGNVVSEFSDGDIVIFGSKEFVRSNGAWEELGDVTGVSELLTWNDEPVQPAE